MTSRPIEIHEAREAIWVHVRATNATVEHQYELEQEFGFDPGGEAHRESKDFVVLRLTAGAEMLRALWWSAWIESEELAELRRAQGWTE